MSMLEVAMLAKVPCDVLHNATFAHPTLGGIPHNTCLP